MVKFTIPGEPVPQGRPRAGKTKYGKIVMYDPKQSKDYKQFVSLIARQHAPKTKLEGALFVRMKIYRQIYPKAQQKRTERYFWPELSALSSNQIPIITQNQYWMPVTVSFTLTIRKWLIYMHQSFIQISREWRLKFERLIFMRSKKHNN